MRPVALGRRNSIHIGSAQILAHLDFQPTAASTTERIAPIFGPAWFSWESRQTDWNILPVGAFPDQSLGIAILVAAAVMPWLAREKRAKGLQAVLR